jgi:hypothetical protein
LPRVSCFCFSWPQRVCHSVAVKRIYVCTRQTCLAFPASVSVDHKESVIQLPWSGSMHKADLPRVSCFCFSWPQRVCHSVAVKRSERLIRYHQEHIAFRGGCHPFMLLKRGLIQTVLLYTASGIQSSAASDVLVTGFKLIGGARPQE